MKLHQNYNLRVLLGDIHGSWYVITDFLKKSNNDKICLIQVGDFGIGFESNDLEKLEKLNQNLIDKDSHLLIIRGNHDDPFWFSEENYKYEKEKLTNIYFVPDYTVLNINGDNILFIGGAISIDRKYRLSHDMMYNTKSYWKDELVNFDYDFAEKIRNIDRIVCHTSPDFCEPVRFNNLVYSFAQNDDKLLQELRDERSNMTKLINEIMKNNNIKEYFYGHFHNSYRLYHNDCSFVCLNINEFYCI